MRGEDGVLTSGERLDPIELATLAGDKGRGEEHRDGTGDLVRGPAERVPETNVGEGAARAVKICGEVTADALGTVGADAQAERVF